VRSNADEVEKALRKTHQQQIPFATSKALNEMGVEILKFEQSRMRRVFHIRSNFVVKGLKLRRSNKRQKPKIRIVLGHRDEYMVDHETGKKRKGKGGGRVGIPTALTKRTPTGKTRKGTSPRELIAAEKARKVEQGAGRALVAGSTKRKRGRVKNLGGLGIFWLLRRSVRIRPRWKLRKSIKREARQRYGSHFLREFDKAIRTAKPRPLQ
jgi:hypothetical protein